MQHTVIVACATLKNELLFTMDTEGVTIPIEWVDSGLHLWPLKLHTRVTEVLHNLSNDYKTVLLLFGFCGNSMVGLKASGRKLVLPIAADCIPIFLGSRQKCEELGGYTYFFTEGYLNSERTFITELEEMKKRYGVEKALRYTKKMLAHYKQLSVIDTGAFDVPPIVDTVRLFAEEIDIPVNTVNGNLRIIKDLITGNWSNENFLVVEPEGEITFEHSLLAGKSQLK